MIWLRSRLDFVIVALLRNFYQILISYCKFIMPKASKCYIFVLWFFSKIFIKCFENSILLSGPNRTAESPSYLFSLVWNTFSKIELTQLDSFICAPNFTTCAAILIDNINWHIWQRKIAKACPLRYLLKIVAFAVS